MEPKIRLKNYNEEWKTTLIDKLGITYSGLSGKTKEDFGKGDALYITFLNVLNNAKIDTSILEAVNIYKGERQNEVKRGDLLFNTSSETPGEVGMCAAMDDDLTHVYLNSFCFGFRVTDENIDSLFMAYLMRSPVGRRLMSFLAQGATRYNLSKNNFCKAELLFPVTKDEQTAIASLFQHLDSLIQSTQKKIDSLKQVMTASLQCMFPQDGETTPRIRFKGHEGEWEKKLFYELYEPSSIKNKAYGEDKIISVANMYFKPVSYISDEEYLKSYNVMCLGDIAFEGNKSKNFAHGRFVENTIGDGIVSHVFVVLRPISEKYDLQFWKYLINYERIMGPILTRSTKHSTMMTDLVVADFLKEAILVPSYEEQQKIGAFLENLDSQITLHTQRLEKLKQIKSACLDNMFV